MSAVKISECNKIYDGFGFNLEETHLCAGGEIGKCASKQDGGGGLLSKLSDGRWEVVGILHQLEQILVMMEFLMCTQE